MKLFLLITFAFTLNLTVAGQSKTLYIDPGKTIGAPASRLFEDIAFIPLETTKKSTLGTVTQLVVTDSLFIVLDNDTNGLYFFSRTGKFILKYKIKRYRIRDIQYDRAKNALLIFSLNKNYNIPAVKVQQYLESDATKDISKYAKATWFYLDNVKAAKTENFKNFRYAFANPVRFDRNYFAASFIKSKRSNKDTLDYQLKILDNTTVLNNYFPYNKKTASIYYYAGAAQCNIMPTHNDSVLFVTRPFQYEIYTVTPSAVSATYKLVLPVNNAVPASFFNMNFSSRAEMDVYKATNANVASQIDNVISFNNILFFSLTLFRGNNRYIFDNSTDLVYDYKKITADSSSYFIPVSGAIKAFDEQYIYQSISAKSMSDIKKSTASRDIQYNDILNRFFKKLKDSDNPVLIQLHPKQAFDKK